jgi:anti-sigma regulatory factor (Ser/Thr protein kinase)
MSSARRFTSVESAPSQRPQDATIEGLIQAVRELRRGAAALRAENRGLRAEIAQLRPAGREHRRREAPMQAFGRLAEIGLPACVSSPGAARIVVAGCLRGLVRPRIVEDAKLLVTELVTNSLLHGELDERDAVLVRVYLAADALRLEVENSGIAGVVASDTADPKAGRGLGLQVLERLVTRWGVTRDRNTTVWLEMNRA